MNLAHNTKSNYKEISSQGLGMDQLKKISILLRSAHKQLQPFDVWISEWGRTVLEDQFPGMLWRSFDVEAENFSTKVVQVDYKSP